MIADNCRLANVSRLVKHQSGRRTAGTAVDEIMLLAEQRAPILRRVPLLRRAPHCVRRHRRSRCRSRCRSCSRNNRCGVHGGASDRSACRRNRYRRNFRSRTRPARRIRSCSRALLLRSRALLRTRSRSNPCPSDVRRRGDFPNRQSYRGCRGCRDSRCCHDYRDRHCCRGRRDNLRRRGCRCCRDSGRRTGSRWLATGAAAWRHRRPPQPTSIELHYASSNCPPRYKKVG